MNSSNSKKKYSFNFIDVILIIAILASAVTLVYFLRERKIVTSEKTDTVNIIYKLEISPMREEFRNLVGIGDSVTDAIYLQGIGEVTDVSYSPCYYTGTDRENGKQVKNAYPNRITMTLTIKAEAEVTQTGYSINGRELILGEAFSFRVPDFTGNGTCISVAKATEKENTIS